MIKGFKHRYEIQIRLKDIDDKNEIPQKLVKVAEGLKNFDNVGAHTSVGD